MFFFLKFINCGTAVSICSDTQSRFCAGNSALPLLNRADLNHIHRCQYTVLANKTYLIQPHVKNTVISL